MLSKENACYLIVDAIEENEAPNVTASKIHTILASNAVKKHDFNSIVETVKAVYKGYRRNLKNGFPLNKYDLVLESIEKHF